MLALSTASSELGLESRDIAKAAFVESSVHTIVYRQTRRLGGSTRLAAGLRGWYVVPLTARKRTLEGVQWLVRKAFPPPELARYNVGLIRGPRFWRKLRGVQLEAIGRSARDSRKRP